MRLFAAVPVPEPAREQILKLLGKLREAGWPVRWVHDEGLHMTLKFFGEVAPERLDVIAEALRFAAQGAEPLALELGDLGAFPSRSPTTGALGRCSGAGRLSSCCRIGSSGVARPSAFHRKGLPSSLTLLSGVFERDSGFRRGGWMITPRVSSRCRLWLSSSCSTRAC